MSSSTTVGGKASSATASVAVREPSPPPPPLPIPHPTNLSAPIVRDTPDALVVRRQIEEHIGVREAVVARLRGLLPVPTTPEERDELTTALLSNLEQQTELRVRLARDIGELRHTSVAICAGIGRWREAMRRGDGASALPTRELIFCYGGASYLLKMTTDLPFLPLPIAHDPLLLLWFGEQLPWLLAEVPSLARRRRAVVASELAPSFDAPPRPEPGTDAAIELKEASYLLLDEAARCGMPRAPSALARAAKARSRSLHLGIRWQWSAFQVLLYGGESYHRAALALHLCADAAPRVGRNHGPARLPLA